VRVRDFLHETTGYHYSAVVNVATFSDNVYDKKLSYCWETVRRESMPRIAEMGVEMTT